MANNYGFPTTNNNWGIPQTQPQPQSNVIVMNTTSREFAESYPMAPNSTIMFMNYNGRRLYIKTQHANGLSYDFEEMVMFTPMELQQYQNSMQHPQQIQNGNPDELSIIKDRISKLESQLEELMK